VRGDVRDGIVSRRAATDIFGVVLVGDDDPQIDEPATAALRGHLAKEVRPLVTPDRPGAATWVTDAMRPGDVYLINPSRT
jgi:hypothetical protein